MAKGTQALIRHGTRSRVACSAYCSTCSYPFQLSECACILYLGYRCKASVLPGLTPRIAEDSVYAYAEDVLGMTITTSRRTVSVDYVVAEDRAVMDLLDFTMLAIVNNSTFNSHGVMFESTQSRHRPDYFMFHNTAVRGY